MVRDGVLANPNQVLSFVVNRNTLYYLLSVSKTDKPTVYEIWKMDLGTREKEKIVTGPYRYLDLVGGTLYSFNNEKSEFEKIEQ